MRDKPVFRNIPAVMLKSIKFLFQWLMEPSKAVTISFFQSSGAVIRLARHFVTPLSGVLVISTVLQSSNVDDNAVAPALHLLYVLQVKPPLLGTTQTDITVVVVVVAVPT